MQSMNNEGHNTKRETTNIIVGVSITFPEILLKIYKPYFGRLGLFFIPVIYCHLTFEAETSTRSQNVVQQTPSDNTPYLRIMKVSFNMYSLVQYYVTAMWLKHDN